MEKEKVIIELQNGKMATLVIQPFESEMEIDDMLKIDYGNIMGEILTWPLMYNRISNLRAEQENIVSQVKMDTDIFEAQLMEEHRKRLTGSGNKFTVGEVESAVKLDARYAVKKRHFFQVQKNFAYLDALYWSAQSKDQKLNKMIDKMRPEEFEKELLEDTINGVMIKFSRKVI